MPIKDAAKRTEYNRNYQRERCRRLKAPPGICSHYPNCRAKTDGEHKKCAHHLQYMRTYKKTYKVEKPEGSCLRSDCTNLADQGFQSCTPCRTRSNGYRKNIRAEVLAAYGSVCVCCGEDKKEFLSVDHIEGDGAEHRRAIKTPLYTWLRQNKFPSGFRILCMNCNFSLGLHGYCPHGLTQSRPVGLKRGPRKKMTEGQNTKFLEE